jgi:hypothetical protein
MRARFGTFTLVVASAVSFLLAGCGGGGGGNTNPPPSSPTTPTVTVTPSAASFTTAEPISATVKVSGTGAVPTGTVTVKSGSYTSSATKLSAGSATFPIAAGTLPLGTDTLTASYAPDTASSSSYNSASGSADITVTKIPPTVSVTPAATTVASDQDLNVAIAVAGPTGQAVPTGSVVVSSGTYKSAAIALSNGSATIDIPAGTLAAGSVTIAAAFTPDSAGGAVYETASGTSAAISVIVTSTVTVNQGISGPKISDKLLGMNLADWYDPTDPAILPAFQAAGIKAMRWPGGSWSDEYHWKTNSKCYSPTKGAPLQPGGWAHPKGVYQNIINDVEIPGGLDVALTANYGTDSTCTKGGDPQEAADWLTFAEAHGGTVSHITVGNEEYGAWETDLHAKPHDATTYADAAANGFYPAIKAVDKNVPVGVVVNPGNLPEWDMPVLLSAKYDFVEFHYYPQGPGQESDTYLTQTAAQDLTAQIELLKGELKKAGKPDTPIYVGEIGSVYTEPGKQSWSITQGLYAGQVLGEMMNEGVSRLTWWIGFGNCDVDINGNALGNMSGSLYGWQTFGAYNVFSDGPTDGPCGVNSGPAGTMSPTARAFQLFSNVAVDGESVLPAAVAGDNNNVRAYAATHSGGTAIVVFNLNQTTPEPVKITLSGQSSSSGVKVITYNKAIYDKTKNNVWAPPTTTDLGAKTLPLSLWLDPWSMNVIVIQ